MAAKEIKVEVLLHEESVDNLPKPIQALITEALKARANSYAPYSNFPVGAAVLLENGQVVQGNNQENAAYPSGLCAERTALFASRAVHPKQKITAIAVCVKQSAKHVPFPCGGCLQVMAEVEQSQDFPLAVYLIHHDAQTVWRAKNVGQLLPFAFGAKHLKD
jgi:cytidine deaminase